MRHHYPTIIWGFIAEVVLTALIYYLIDLRYGIDTAARWVNNTAHTWLFLVGTFWAFSGQLFVIFINMLKTDFGHWLSWRQAEGVYKTALVLSMIVQFSAAAILIFAGSTKNETVGRVALALLILAPLNMWTLGKNVLDLVGLHREFDQNVSGGDRSR